MEAHTAPFKMAIVLMGPVLLMFHAGQDILLSPKEGFATFLRLVVSRGLRFQTTEPRILHGI